MRPEMNSHRFKTLNRFEKSFRLHGSFTTVNLEISNSILTGLQYIAYLATSGIKRKTTK